MHVPTAYDVLHVWERGLGQTPAHRALELLALACPDRAAAERGGLSAGRRDARLFALRETLFGGRCDGLATCPACGADAELSFDLSALRIPDPEAVPEEVRVEHGPYTARVRLPDAALLAALADRAGDGLDGRALLESCLRYAARDGAEIAARELPDAVIDDIAREMSAADPQADVRLALSCPQCARNWEAVFDIVAFLWSELHAWSIRLLRDVHELAAAYGWSEAEVIALSPGRRQAYLDMVRA
jgi:hypothetical protein